MISKSLPFFYLVVFFFIGCMKKMENSTESMASTTEKMAETTEQISLTTDEEMDILNKQFMVMAETFKELTKSFQMLASITPELKTLIQNFNDLTPEFKTLVVKAESMIQTFSGLDQGKMTDKAPDFDSDEQEEIEQTTQDILSHAKEDEFDDFTIDIEDTK